jgi:carbon-monoxide dehydrogenase large subunit
MVMAGGAVGTACEEIAARAKRIGAKLLQLDPASVELRDGRVHGPNSSVGLSEIAHSWYRRPQDLSGDVDPAGLETTGGYKPQRDSGAFSYAVHAVTVAVDPDLGEVELLDERRSLEGTGHPVGHGARDAVAGRGYQRRA